MKQNYLDSEFTKDKIQENVDKFLKFNTAPGIDKITQELFLRNRDKYIDIIYRKVKDGSYKFTPYKEKLILKSKNSFPRVISIPTLRDRIVLKSLQLILKDIYSDIEMCLPQVCIQKIKDNIKKYDSFIKLDISNFYGNISHGILLSKLKKKIDDDILIKLISSAIQTPTVVEDTSTKNIGKVNRGVAQGLPISNILASIYLRELDVKYKNKNNFTYIRYVDDILILCNNKDQDVIYEEVIYDLEAMLNLPINRDKTLKNTILKDNDKEKSNKEIEFLGYKYGMRKNNKIGLTIKDKNRYKFEKSIIAIFHKFQKDNKMSPEQFVFALNNKITGSITKRFSADGCREYKYGWLFYFSQIEDYALLYHLDNMVDKLLAKFDKCKNIQRNSIKYFTKAFFEIRYNIKNSTYIHRPDILTTEERRELLINIFKIKRSDLTDEITEKLYFKFVYNPIRFEQKDIQKLIS